MACLCSQWDPSPGRPCSVPLSSRIQPHSSLLPQAGLGSALPRLSFIPLARFHNVGWGQGSRGGAELSCRHVWGGLWHSQQPGLGGLVVFPGCHIRAVPGMGTGAGPIAFLRRTQGRGPWDGLTVPCLNPKACKLQGLFSPCPTPLPIPISLIFPAKEHSI